MRGRATSAGLVVAVLALVPVVAASPGTAAAQDEREDTIELMGQPADYTDVIDAVDGSDPFDLNLVITYERELSRGIIEREDPYHEDAASGRSTAHLFRVGRYNHVQNRLVLGVDIGVFHDLAAYVRFPIILSDTREIVADEGADAAVVNSRLSDDSGQLFQLPFRSPERSGIDYFAVGARWGIFNQYRSRWMPTWVVGLEGRFSIGDILHACAAGGPCDNGGSVDAAGISRGTNALRAYTMFSRRIGHYVEPYAGVNFMVEWPKRGTDFGFFEDLEGVINDLPPIFGEFTAGMEIVPWENREQFQRFAIDMRIFSAYHSEGREYSPLFDALGSSMHPELVTEQSDGTARTVDFGGITDNSAYASFGGRLGLGIQAARYIRFSFGGQFTYDAAHMLTFADACNPDVTPDGPSDARGGNCRSGIINPHHRPTIDLPGRRFRVNESTTFDLFVSATGMF